MNDESTDRGRLVGINHLALAVGDLDEALGWYGELFEFDLRGKSDKIAFIDLGDQFLALAEIDQDDGYTDEHRHFGLVVDEPRTVERRLADVDCERLQTAGFDIRDPWGNRIQIVAYEDVQFTKAEHILAGMELDNLTKSASAIDELEEKGMGPDRDTS